MPIIDSYLAEEQQYLALPLQSFAALSINPLALKRMKRAICTDAWHNRKQDKGDRSTANHVFYFMFSEECGDRNSRQKKLQNGAKLSKTRLEYLDNVWAHLAEGCFILMVCLHLFLPNFLCSPTSKP